MSRLVPRASAAAASGSTGVAKVPKFRPQSRIGKQPILIPKEVTIKLKDQHLAVKGPKGELEREFHELVTVKEEDGKLIFSRVGDTKRSSAMHGMSRALAANMVKGVSEGFEKQMELIGVGYRAAMSGADLTLSVGYSHPVVMKVPEAVKVNVEKGNTIVTIMSYDKQALGDFCADIRKVRPPEPYKGKGIRFVGERIKQKAGKSGK